MPISKIVLALAQPAQRLDDRLGAVESVAKAEQEGRGDHAGLPRLAEELILPMQRLVPAIGPRRGHVGNEDLHRVVGVFLRQGLGLQARLQLVPNPGRVDLVGESLLEQLLAAQQAEAAGSRAHEAVCGVARPDADHGRQQQQNAPGGQPPSPAAESDPEDRADGQKKRADRREQRHNPQANFRIAQEEPPEQPQGNAGDGRGNEERPEAVLKGAASFRIGGHGAGLGANFQPVARAGRWRGRRCRVGDTLYQAAH